MIEPGTPIRLPKPSDYYPPINSFDMPADTEVVWDGAAVVLVFPNKDVAREFTKFALAAVAKAPK